MCSSTTIVLETTVFWDVQKVIFFVDGSLSWTVEEVEFNLWIGRVMSPDKTVNYGHFRSVQIINCNFSISIMDFNCTNANFLFCYSES